MADIYTTTAAIADSSSDDTSTIVSYSYLSDVVNYKDINEHMPGGLFGINGKLPGNVLWDATNTPKMEPIVAQGNTGISAMLNGEILTYLQYGFNDIMSLVNGGKLDLMFDDDMLNTIMYNITIEVITPDGGIITLFDNDVTIDKDHDGGHTTATGFTSSNESMSLDDIASATSMSYSTTENIVGMLGRLSGIPLGSSIAVALYDYATGEEVRAEQVIANGLLSTVQNTMTKVTTQAIANMAEITSTTGAIALTLAVGVLVNEAMEVALGLDNHFGLGGDIMTLGTGEIKYNDAGEAQYESVYTIETALKTSVVGQLLHDYDIIDYSEAEQDRMNELAGYTSDDMQAAMDQSAVSAEVDNPEWSAIDFANSTGDGGSTLGGFTDVNGTSVSVDISTATALDNALFGGVSGTDDWGDNSDSGTWGG